MALPNHKKRKVTDQQDALTSYLEALLTDVGFAEADTELSNLPLLEHMDVLEEMEVLDSNVDMEPLPAGTEHNTLESVQREMTLAAPVAEQQTTTLATSFAEPLPIFLNPPSLIPLPVVEPAAAPQDKQSSVIDPEMAQADDSIDDTAKADGDAYATQQERHNPFRLEQHIDADSTAAHVVQAGAGEPPEWAQSRFQCLIFSVAGLKIAAPLEKLNGIIEWPARITLIPGRAPWFLGLYRNRETNVQIMDLARILRLQAQLQLNTTIGEAAHEVAGKYIMLIDDGRIGLASDSVANMMTLEPQAVKWHAIPDATRRIVAGTVVEQMCAVLDIDALIEHINSA